MAIEFRFFASACSKILAKNVISIESVFEQTLPGSLSVQPAQVRHVSPDRAGRGECVN